MTLVFLIFNIGDSFDKISAYPQFSEHVFELQTIDSAWRAQDLSGKTR